MTEITELTAELRHMVSLLKAEVNKLEVELGHEHEMVEHRLVQLEKREEDHETRIRSATEGVTQFKMWTGLASGGSGIMALVALIKAFFGG